MKVVLDTNVLIAAFIARGTCHELLEHVAVAHELILSEFILSEFTTVLAQKFKFSPAPARRAAELLRPKAVVVNPRVPAPQVCRDPDDDHVIGTALTGKCDCIVSGDRDLTDIEQFEDIHIVSPNAFWSFEAAREATR
jgi:putative PIN family toxin of toxin-antitoxin system